MPQFHRSALLFWSLFTWGLIVVKSVTRKSPSKPTYTINGSMASKKVFHFTSCVCVKIFCSTQSLFECRRISALSLSRKHEACALLQCFMLSQNIVAFDAVSCHVWMLRNIIERFRLWVFWLFFMISLSFLRSSISE